MARNDTSEPLSSFLKRARSAEPGGGEIIDQAHALLEQAYVHLPDSQAAGEEPLGLLAALQRAGSSWNACPPWGRGGRYGWSGAWRTPRGSRGVSPLSWAEPPGPSLGRRGAPPRAG
jgi:hypothetical protein